MKRTVLKVLASHVAPFLLRILGRLTRITIRGAEHLEALRKSGEGFIFVLWHGRMFVPIYIHRRQGIQALASLHKDGAYISLALEKLGYTLARGSSTRGGTEAFYEMASSLEREKIPVAIIPDGPRGPARVMKPGIIALAQKTGAAILPMTFSSKPCVRLNSWDGHMIPLPFSKSFVLYGEPVRVPQSMTDEEREERRRMLENVLNDLAAKADALAGWPAGSDARLGGEARS
jgi:hypothetical protein